MKHKASSFRVFREQIKSNKRFILFIAVLIFIGLWLLSSTPTKPKIDFKKFGNDLRWFKKSHDILYQQYKNNDSNAIKHVKELDNILFPWLDHRQDSITLRESFRGKGLVMCVGNIQINLAVSTILMIRNIHNVDLPIEIFYNGYYDLSIQNQLRLESIPNVKTIDIQTIFDNSILKLGGWAIKPFALLACSFDYAMLIDADIIFLQSPETLFNNDLYLKHGALFFKDRSLFSANYKIKDWLNDLLPNRSDKVNRLRIFNSKTAHQQESGVVLVNKTRSFYGLLAACSFNSDKIRNVVYDIVHGDKETFWVGFETVGQDYEFNPSLPGSCGLTSDENQICSAQLLHFDDLHNPIWLNGGLLKDKYNPKTSGFVEMEMYNFEPGNWLLKDNNMACLKSNEQPKPFTSETKIIIQKSLKIAKTEYK